MSSGQGIPRAFWMSSRRSSGVDLLSSWWEPVCSSSDYRSVSVVSGPFWHAAGMTSLEGFECGGADQHVCRSDRVAVCPSVTVNPFGSLPDRACSGHAS
jgi:hypothetical protein